MLRTPRLTVFNRGVRCRVATFRSHLAPCLGFPPPFPKKCLLTNSSGFRSPVLWGSATPHACAPIASPTKRQVGAALADWQWIAPDKVPNVHRFPSPPSPTHSLLPPLPSPPTNPVHLILLSSGERASLPRFEDTNRLFIFGPGVTIRFELLGYPPPVWISRRKVALVLWEAF